MQDIEIGRRWSLLDPVLIHNDPCVTFRLNKGITRRHRSTVLKANLLMSINNKGIF